MQKQSINLIITLTLMIFLSACGGGESDSSVQQVASSSSPVQTDDSVPTDDFVPTVDPVPADDSVPTVDSVPADDPVPTVDSGNLILMDAGAISGLKVMCNLTELVTGSDGFIECEETPITAYLGEFKVGDVDGVPIDGLIYVQDLLHLTRTDIAHPEVTKLSMILQSLDKDADPLNGITLDSNVLDLLSSHLNAYTVLESLTFVNVASSIDEIIQAALSQDSTSKLKAVSYDTAQSNLATSVANAPALTYEQRVDGGI